MDKTIRILLICGVLLCLLQVWLPDYYMTGDGPCHLYNAQILHDLWSQKNKHFYENFYTIVYQPNPNWMATVIMSLLLYIVKGIIAEKIFLTLYILSFTGGYYLLLRKISVDRSWLLIIFLFVFPHTLAKGFYNFSFSIAFYFWVVWAWLRFLEKRDMRNAGLFFTFTALLFFTHLLSFIFAAITCGALVLSYTIAHRNENIKGYGRLFFIKNVFFLILFQAPFFFLMKWFTNKEGGMRIHLRPHFYRLIELLEFKYQVNVTHTEDILAATAGIIMLLLFGLSFIKRKKIVWHKYDGFLFSLVLVLFIYLCFPEAFLGRLILISMRVQPFVFILICCCIAYRFPVSAPKKKEILFGLAGLFVISVSTIVYLFFILPPGIMYHSAPGMHIVWLSIALFIAFFLTAIATISEWPYERIKISAGVSLFLCFLCLTFVRIYCLLAASSAVSDYLSVADYIRPYKVVMPIYFSSSGTDVQGETIADRNYLFVHVAQYLGVGKSLIILDNYEANMGYFPISWRGQKNPYSYMNVEQATGSVPMYPEMKTYEKNMGINIDYVLMWDYKKDHSQETHFSQLDSLIPSGYHLIYTSPAGYAMLYERNNQ